MRLIDDDRSAVAWLNYANPVKPDPYRPVGPNTLGEYFWPVETNNNGRRVGFSYIEPNEN